mgnify:CR=1 FL=1|tara:strand:- start:245 stop:862 length:618 start_codon:yes stop_codon:yes gene_type:complete
MDTPMQGSEGPDASVPQLDREVFIAHNEVRTNPHSMISDLEAQLPNFNGNILKNDETNVHLRTNEGAAAVQECIDFLKTVEPLPPLVWKGDISLACRDHAQDTGPKGTTGHDGSDGNKLADRLKRYGAPVATYGENLSYGQNTGRGVVLQLLTDDGVPSRGHRTNIFNPAFKVMGCFSGTHSNYGTMTCIDYAGGWRKEGEEDPV